MQSAVPRLLMYFIAAILVIYTSSRVIVDVENLLWRNAPWRLSLLKAGVMQHRCTRVASNGPNTSKCGEIEVLATRPIALFDELYTKIHVFSWVPCIETYRIYSELMVSDMRG
jgi:hypothetical protein